MTPRASTVSLCVALSATLLVAACTDQRPTLLEPGPEAAPQLSVSGDDLSNFFVPNGVPYRNPEYKNATGRSGEASLTARALMSKDGSTELDLTTGALDGTPPPHDITKLQIKYIDPNQDTLWTKNENKLATGYVHRVYDNVARHGYLQTQANVLVPNASGKNGRTGVVTISERINLRPDLAVTAIQGPPTAVRNSGVSFTGFVSELNGDLSATANCVFYVDGQEAARSNGIWVGEGDEVTCLMHHVFDAIGTHTVTLAVEDVSPGDWDLSNNTFSTTIEIVAIYQFRGSLSVSEDHYERYQNYSMSYTDSGSGWYTTRTYHYNTNNLRVSVRAQLYGWSSQVLSVPVRVTMQQRSNGVVHDALDTPGLGSPGSECFVATTAKSSINVCSYPTSTSVNISRYSGRATYFTNDWKRTKDCHYYWFGGWHCQEWTETLYYHSSNDSWGGGFQPLGSEYTFDVRLVDALGQTFKSDPVSVPLGPYFRYSPITGGYVQESGKGGSRGY